MIAILRSLSSFMGRIFTGPNITFFTVIGMCIMILGGIVCACAVQIKEKLTGKPQDEQSALPVKLAGLVVVIIGLVITIYLKG